MLASRGFIQRQNVLLSYSHAYVALARPPLTPHSAAKERLHKSLALPTSYADVKPALKPSKPADDGKQQQLSLHPSSCCTTTCRQLATAGDCYSYRPLLTPAPAAYR